MNKNHWKSIVGEKIDREFYKMVKIKVNSEMEAE